MAMRFLPGNYLPRISLYFSRNYHRHLSHSDAIESFLDYVREQCRLGFSTVETPFSIFFRLDSLRPRPSIAVFSQLFDAMSKIKPGPPPPRSPPRPSIANLLICLSNYLELSGMRPDCHSIGLLSKCYCDLGRPDFGVSVMAKGLTLGYPPNIAMLTTLDQAAQLLDKSVQQPHPDHVAMFKHSIICSRALHLLENMEAEPEPEPQLNPNPTHVVYNAKLDNICKHWMLPEIFGPFKEMKDEGILPDVRSYTTLLQSLCILGRWDDAKELVAEMMDNNIAPNFQEYSTLVDIYSKDGHVAQALALFEFMTRRGVRANIFIYNALLDVYCLHGEMEKAENLLDVMVKDGVIRPNVVTFTNLIHGYCNSLQIDKALEMFNGMHLKGTHITPNVFTYNTMINALCKDERFQLAFQLFEDMKHRGVAPNVSTYTSLIDNLWRNDEQICTAISLSKEMKNRGLNLCTRT